MVLKLEILLVREQAFIKLPLIPLMESHWVLHISSQYLQIQWKIPKRKTDQVDQMYHWGGTRIGKNFINDKREQEQDYKNAMVMLRRQSS